MGLLLYAFLAWVMVRVGLGEILLLLSIITILAVCYPVK